MRLSGLCFALLVPLTSATVFAQGSVHGSFAERRRAHPTRLLSEAPAPQAWQPETPPSGVLDITFPAGPGRLKAWFARPAHPDKAKVPAVVFFHGGFAFGADDWNDARPFLEAGFAVLAPTLRGENGNPGHYEAFFGEVDDGRAAVTWLAGQPGIDKARIYAFGHSAGGVIAALLSLYDDLPLRSTGSAGGLYDNWLFEHLRVPFNVADREELNLRELGPNLDVMRVEHLAYVGRSDVGCQHALPDLRKRVQVTKAPLQIIELPGDHLSSKAAAIEAFRQWIVSH